MRLLKVLACVAALVVLFTFTNLSGPMAVIRSAGSDPSEHAVDPSDAEQVHAARDVRVDEVPVAGPQSQTEQAGSAAQQLPIASTATQAPQAAAAAPQVARDDVAAAALSVPKERTRPTASTPARPVATCNSLDCAGRFGKEEPR